MAFTSKNVEIIVGMFSGCNSLTYISPLAKWDVSNARSLSYMFFGCHKLKDIMCLQEWNVSSSEQE